MGEEGWGKIDLWNALCEKDSECESQVDGLLKSSDDHGEVQERIIGLVKQKEANQDDFVEQIVFIPPIEDTIWYIEHVTKLNDLFRNSIEKQSPFRCPDIRPPWVKLINVLNQRVSEIEEERNSYYQHIQQDLRAEISFLYQRIWEMRKRENIVHENVAEILKEVQAIRRLGEAERYPKASEVATCFYEKYRDLCENRTKVIDTVEAISDTADFPLVGDDRCKILSAEPAIYFAPNVIYLEEIPPFIKVPTFMDQIEVGVSHEVVPGPVGKALLKRSA